ncbi:MAG: ABC transporter ATP-binding protein [Propionibacteriaceae bacterium]|nr:ABC transporter ATP-binding protein [Propionibacteriaceae bacterium]
MTDTHELEKPRSVAAADQPDDFVKLSGIVKTYGTNTVLNQLDLSIPQGELLSLLGPSGCGKTTALRMLAGLEPSDAGTVVIGGKDVTREPVRRRGIGIVFQSYSLFPHMSATENVGYGLRFRKVDKATREKKAKELLELVGLEQHMTKFPNQMSGGQQQRVALARALATEPKVLLLDEPLSALDAKVRVQLRDEIRRIQAEAGITTLMVTHDQEEALTMSDRVGVMQAGRIEQLGTPDELYHQPRTPFIASFVGVVNRIPGEARDGKVLLVDNEVTIANRPGQQDEADGQRIDMSTLDGPVNVLVRPEDISLEQGSTQGTGVVEFIQLRGPMSSVTVRSSRWEQPLRVDMSTPEAARFSVGEQVRMHLDRRSAVVEKRA